MRAARPLPSSASRRSRLRRAPTAANSAATYKPVTRMRKMMTSAANSIGPEILPQQLQPGWIAAQLDGIRGAFNTRAMPRRLRAVLAVLLLAAGSLQLSHAQSSGADIVLRPGSGAAVFGGWTVVSDATAAGGKAVRHPNAGAAKLLTPLAQPAHYFEQTFAADAGVPYRLWIRGRAQNDNWANDSVYVQFDTTVEGGAEKYRIGSPSALDVNLEDCSGCGLAGWGWQDTGWGVG